MPGRVGYAPIVGMNTLLTLALVCGQFGDVAAPVKLDDINARPGRGDGGASRRPAVRRWGAERRWLRPPVAMAAPFGDDWSVKLISSSAPGEPTGVCRCEL